jgi:hypothetical protein
MCACVDHQRSRGIVIARLRSSVQSLLHQRRNLDQLTYLYVTEDQEPTSHQTTQSIISSTFTPLLGNGKHCAWTSSNDEAFIS